MKPLLKITAALLGLTLAACLDLRVADPEKEGNSSETVALVGGSIVDQNGKTVPGARVTLVPDGFNPLDGEAVPANLTTHTNINGEFFLSRIPKGRYAVEARHPDGGTRCFKSGLDLNAKTRIPADTLRGPGHVRLRVPDYLKIAKGAVFIPHSTYAVPVTGAMVEHGIIDLDSVPSGNYPALAYSPDTGIGAPDTVGRNVDVTPGDTTDLGAFAGWRHAAAIAINTTSSGADVPLDVLHFPMLVRLDASNFNFSEAAADGKDLRFAKADGKELAFQINDWDAAASRASVWVAMDTVLGNNSAQSFAMYWGKANVESGSDGMAVFGTAAGYGGVWHLEEEAPGTGAEGLYRNSAGLVDNGLDSLASTDRQGVIGNGHYFQDGQYVRVRDASPALRPKTTVTLSAWIKTVSTDSFGGEIASMGNDFGIRVTPQGEAYVFSFNKPHPDSTSFSLSTSGLHLLDGSWHHIAGILDGPTAEIYVDGVFKAGRDFSAGVFEYDGGPDFLIGHHGDNETVYDFKGSIDEVRMLDGLSTPSWLRLTYETQKPGASVLTLTRDSRRP
jgi:hypothetical protein